MNPLPALASAAPTRPGSDRARPPHAGGDPRPSRACACPTLAALVTLAVPAVVALPPSALAAAPSTQSPLEALAENPRQAERLKQPGDAFLRDGKGGLQLDPLFYASEAFGTEERYGLFPRFPVDPRESPAPDSARVRAALQIGNEAGDPLMREPLEERGNGNRTPYAAGHVQAAFGPGFQAFLDARQDDHFSYGTFSRRVDRLGDRPWSDAAWLGENLPLQSLLRAGGDLYHRGGRLTFSHARGTVWGLGASGERYPLKAQGTEISAGNGESFALSLRHYRYDPLSEFSEFRLRGEVQEVHLRSEAGAGTPWRTGLQWGYRVRDLSGPAVDPVDEHSYPMAFYGSRAFRSDDSARAARVAMRLAQEEGIFTARLRAEGDWKLGHGFSSEPTLRAYYRYAGDGEGLSPVERLAGLEDPEGEASFAPRGHGRGAGLAWRHAWTGSGPGGGVLLAALTAQGAGEWGVPRFEGEARTWLGYPVRVGAMEASRHALWQGGAAAEIGWEKPAGHASPSVRAQALKLHGRWREFSGAESRDLEWDPAVWSGGLLARACLFDDLELEARWNWVDAKTYRGFGETLRTPAHAEAHFAARHSLGERVSVSVALLNAFGEERREHPLGNPYRFRAMAGAQGRF